MLVFFPQNAKTKHNHPHITSDSELEVAVLFHCTALKSLTSQKYLLWNCGLFVR